MRSFIFILLCCCSFPAFALIDYNTNCIAAYQKITAFKLPEARLLIAKEKKNNPQNAAILFLENSVDFFSLFANENEEEFHRLEKNKALRIAALEKEDQKDPYTQYFIAEIQVQWALTRFKFQEYVSGALEINKAYTLLKDCKKAHPDFLPVNKSLGMINILLGIVPPGLKKALSAFGLQGNSAYGLSLFDAVLHQSKTAKYAYLKDEALFYYLFIQVEYLRDKSKDAAMQELIDGMDKESLLHTYIAAFWAIKHGRNNEAINILVQRPSGAAYHPFYHLDYLLALCKLNRMDDDADLYFQRYIQQYKGAFFVKDAYLRLSWFYLLKGNIQKYHAFNDLTKTLGDDISEKDKQAMKDAYGAVPNLYLLAARVSYDGGYYEKALTYLKDKKPESFTNSADKLEYAYRLGRIYQELKKYDAAIQNYASVISQGINSKVYYVPNAALQMGVLFEERKNYEQARYYFNLCISLKGHEYKNSLDSRAKAGLLRIEGKK